MGTQEVGTPHRQLSEADRPEWGVPRTRTVHWHDPAVTAAAGAHRNGLAFLQAIRDGVLPPPPIATLLGMLAIFLITRLLRG